MAFSDIQSMSSGSLEESLSLLYVIKLVRSSTRGIPPDMNVRISFSGTGPYGFPKAIVETDGIPDGKGSFIPLETIIKTLSKRFWDALQRNSQNPEPFRMEHVDLVLFLLDHITWRIMEDGDGVGRLSATLA